MLFGVGVACRILYSIVRNLYVKLLQSYLMGENFSKKANHSHILCGASFVSEKGSLYKWYRSHDQDGHHAQLW